MNNEILVCECGDPSHQLVFSYDDGDEEVYVSVLLNPNHPWYKRLWVALKYIFGHRSIYGDFDEVILTKNHVGKLQNIINILNK